MPSTIADAQAAVDAIVGSACAKWENEADQVARAQALTRHWQDEDFRQYLAYAAFWMRWADGSRWEAYAGEIPRRAAYVRSLPPGEDTAAWRFDGARFVPSHQPATPRQAVDAIRACADAMVVERGEPVWQCRVVHCDQDAAPVRTANFGRLERTSRRHARVAQWLHAIDARLGTGLTQRFLRRREWSPGRPF